MPYNSNRRPAFNVSDGNGLLGKNTLAILNSEMCRALCDHLELTVTDESDPALFAFGKQIRKRYWHDRPLHDIEENEDVTVSTEPRSEAYDSASGEMFSSQ